MKKVKKSKKFECDPSCDCKNKSEFWNHCEDCDDVQCDYSRNPSVNKGFYIDHDGEQVWRCPPCYKKACVKPIYVLDDMETWSAGIPSRINFNHD